MNPEQERANRIYIRIDEDHIRLSSVYEELVDRDFNKAELLIKLIIKDLRLILRSINDNDDL